MIEESVYGDEHIHSNDGLQLNRGISDEAKTWQAKYYLTIRHG